MVNKPNPQYENNYRFSPETMKKLRKRFLISWGVSGAIGIIGFFVFAAIISSQYDPNGLGNPMPGWTDAVGGVILLITFVAFPLVYSAWLGGRSIHRFGPLGTVTAVVGLMVMLAGKYFGLQYAVAGVVITVVGVAVSFYLGHIANVPMWLQLPIFRSPRLYINKPTEEASKKESVKK